MTEPRGDAVTYFTSDLPPLDDHVASRLAERLGVRIRLSDIRASTQAGGGLEYVLSQRVALHDPSLFVQVVQRVDGTTSLRLVGRTGADASKTIDELNLALLELGPPESATSHGALLWLPTRAFSQSTLYQTFVPQAQQRGPFPTWPSDPAAGWPGQRASGVSLYVDSLSDALAQATVEGADVTEVRGEGGLDFTMVATPTGLRLLLCTAREPGTPIHALTGFLSIRSTDPARDAFTLKTIGGWATQVFSSEPLVADLVRDSRLIGRLERGRFVTQSQHRLLCRGPMPLPYDEGIGRARTTYRRPRGSSRSTSYTVTLRVDDEYGDHLLAQSTTGDFTMVTPKPAPSGAFPATWAGLGLSIVVALDRAQIAIMRALHIAEAVGLEVPGRQEEPLAGLTRHVVANIIEPTVAALAEIVTQSTDQDLADIDAAASELQDSAQRLMSELRGWTAEQSEESGSDYYRRLHRLMVDAHLLPGDVSVGVVARP